MPTPSEHVILILRFKPIQPDRKKIVKPESKSPIPCPNWPKSWLYGQTKSKNPKTPKPHATIQIKLIFDYNFWLKLWKSILAQKLLAMALTEVFSKQ